MGRLPSNHFGRNEQKRKEDEKRWKKRQDKGQGAFSGSFG